MRGCSFLCLHCVVVFGDPHLLACFVCIVMRFFVCVFPPPFFFLVLSLFVMFAPSSRFQRRPSLHDRPGTGLIEADSRDPRSPGSVDDPVN